MLKIEYDNNDTEDGKKVTVRLEVPCCGVVSALREAAEMQAEVYCGKWGSQ